MPGRQSTLTVGSESTSRNRGDLAQRDSGQYAVHPGLGHRNEAPLWLWVSLAQEECAFTSAIFHLKAGLPL